MASIKYAFLALHLLLVPFLAVGGRNALMLDEPTESAPMPTPDVTGGKARVTSKHRGTGAYGGYGGKNGLHGGYGSYGSYESHGAYGGYGYYDATSGRGLLSENDDAPTECWYVTKWWPRQSCSSSSESEVCSKVYKFGSEEDCCVKAFPNGKCGPSPGAQVTGDEPCWVAATYYPKKTCKQVTDYDTCNSGTNLWTTEQQCCQPGAAFSEGCSPLKVDSGPCYVATSWYKPRMCGQVDDEDTCSRNWGVFATMDACCIPGAAFEEGCGDMLPTPQPMPVDVDGGIGGSYGGQYGGQYGKYGPRAGMKSVGRALGAGSGVFGVQWMGYYGPEGTSGAYGYGGYAGGYKTATLDSYGGGYGSGYGYGYGYSYGY